METYPNCTSQRLVILPSEIVNCTLEFLSTKLSEPFVNAVKWECVLDSVVYKAIDYVPVGGMQSANNPVD